MNLLEIPNQYDTIEKKLLFLKQEHIRIIKNDSMDMNYSNRLYLTEKYWEKLLNVNISFKDFIRKNNEYEGRNGR